MSLREKVNEALESTGGVWTADEMIGALQMGLMVGWIYEDSLVIGNVHGETLVFHLAAGDLEHVLALVESAYEWGRQMGATRAVFVGRPGWARPLADHGWEAKSKLTLFEKSL